MAPIIEAYLPQVELCLLCSEKICHCLSRVLLHHQTWHGLVLSHSSALHVLSLLVVDYTSSPRSNWRLHITPHWSLLLYHSALQLQRLLHFNWGSTHYKTARLVHLIVMLLELFVYLGLMFLEQLGGIRLWHTYYQIVHRNEFLCRSRLLLSGVILNLAGRILNNLLLTAMISHLWAVWLFNLLCALCNIECWLCAVVLHVWARINLLLL